MRYSLGQDFIFIILALISALALVSQHPLAATTFFILALLSIAFEHKIYEYVMKA